MPRYRPFSANNITDYNSLYNYKQGSEAYIYAREHSSAYNNSNNRNFKMDYCDCKEKTSVINYKDYKTYINMAKAASYYNPNCDSCIGVPINIINGPTSSIEYNQLKTDFNINNGDHCECPIKIPVNNKCKELEGKLYPYGTYINNKKNPLIYIHSVKNLENCNVQKNCPANVICSCENKEVNCSCCTYNTITPLTYKTYFKYNNPNNETCNINISAIPQYKIDYLNENKVQEENQLKQNINLSYDAINAYSKSSINGCL